MPKMNPKWVALCSAAVGSIYLSGMGISHLKEGQIPTNIQENLQVQAGNVEKDDTPQAKAVQPETRRMYADGTFSGQASNRIGAVTVAVTIQNDQITNVDITDVNTHYSSSYINDLPSEVVSKQSYDVDNVSGATLSTEDFRNAVQSALEKAKA
ncbi:FMN-binding protein [Rossellomorea marisflavi]|uniref:FMN-binding protein n=1 Tax=Rossellomorea marisflavi TaxID=189381 RepID=UPI0027A21457|nr:FMN-binding protein [Rossellomorea marisflavi]UTE72899.1 FMN-binding protein [Rossellomorea marisflavi]